MPYLNTLCFPFQKARAKSVQWYNRIKASRRICIRKPYVSKKLFPSYLALYILYIQLIPNRRGILCCISGYPLPVPFVGPEYK